MPECANCVRLSKRNRQLSNQLITAQTKCKKSAKEIKVLKKQLEESISGTCTYIFTVIHFSEILALTRYSSIRVEISLLLLLLGIATV